MLKELTCKLYKENDISVRTWSGGITRELAIYPEEAYYPDRDFIWRISSADIEQEESEFTKLPDYDRTIMVLSGEVVLSYEGNRVARLKELEQDSFDGEWTTRSFGKITDYNLMVLKGNRGMLEAIKVTDQKIFPEIPEGFNKPDFDSISDCYYCHQGYAVITAGNEMIMLKEGQQLVVNMPRTMSGCVGIMGDGIVIRALVSFLDEPMTAEEIPKEKIKADDIKAAYFIAYSNFRGAKHIFRSLKTIWYDQALQKAIDRLEKAYIPLIILFIGLFAVTWAAENLWGQKNIGWAILIWLAVDIGFITPGLFLLVLPKPVRKHMKPVETLNKYERKLYEAEKNRNPRIEKVLKRYRITGRNYGDEFKGRDYKSFK